MIDTYSAKSVGAILQQYQVHKCGHIEMKDPGIGMDNLPTSHGVHMLADPAEEVPGLHCTQAEGPDPV